MKYQAVFLDPKTGKSIVKDFELPDHAGCATFEVVIITGTKRCHGFYPSHEIADFHADCLINLSGLDVAIRKWAFPGPIPGNDFSWVEYKKPKVLPKTE